MTDLAETAGVLKGAQAQHAQFAQLAIDHKADDRALDETVQARLKQQNREIVGDGERVELSQAQAVLSSPAGVALSSTDSALLAARDVALSAGQDVSVSTAARWLASVGHGVSLFTRSLGIKAFAARGKVQVQAQSDELEVLADQVAKFISAKKSIQIAAKDEVLLTAKGSYIKVNSAGIEQGTPATHIVYAATKAMLGPRSLDFGLPQTNYPRYSSKLQILDSITKLPIANRKCELTLSDGSKFEKQTDSKGYIEFEQDSPDVLNVHVFFQSPKKLLDQNESAQNG